jgi:hypothetical protein
MEDGEARDQPSDGISRRNHNTERKELGGPKPSLRRVHGIDRVVCWMKSRRCSRSKGEASCRWEDDSLPGRAEVVSRGHHLLATHIRHVHPTGRRSATLTDVRRWWAVAIADSVVVPTWRSLIVSTARRLETYRDASSRLAAGFADRLERDEVLVRATRPVQARRQDLQHRGEIHQHSEPSRLSTKSRRSRSSKRKR